jgi:hypothetical protein
MVRTGMSTTWGPVGRRRLPPREDSGQAEETGEGAQKGGGTEGERKKREGVRVWSGCLVCVGVWHWHAALAVARSRVRASFAPLRGLAAAWTHCLSPSSHCGPLPPDLRLRSVH